MLSCIDVSLPFDQDIGQKASDARLDQMIRLANFGQSMGLPASDVNGTHTGLFNDNQNLRVKLRDRLIQIRALAEFCSCENG